MSEQERGTITLEKPGEADLESDDLHIGHYPITWPDYSVKEKALCGKDLQGIDIPPEVETELCVVCKEMAANIARRFDSQWN
jgi:hypothetical protein